LQLRKAATSVKNTTEFIPMTRKFTNPDVLTKALEFDKSSEHVSDMMSVIKLPVEQAIPPPEKEV
jgi:hypothetical protein